jgi:NADH-quinone oxidoreductase subunit J
MEALVFWLFAILAVAGAVMLIFHKNPIHSALSLIATLFSTAALYVLLNAGFLAVMQVLIYAGAIMVLFVFVIMMLNLQSAELGIRSHAVKKAIAAAIAIAVGVKFITVLGGLSIDKAVLGEGFGTVQTVGQIMLVDYVLPFEAVSVLLLSALVGAVMIAKKRV